MRFIIMHKTNAQWESGQVHSRTLFPGEYSVPLTRSYVWDPWSLAGLAVIATTTLLSLRAFRQGR